MSVEAVSVWPMVRGLSEHDRDELFTMGARRRYRRNEVIFHQGDVADSVHLIEEGHVASRAFTEEGDAVTYRLLGPGEVFGLLALQSGTVRRYGTTVALDPTVTRSESPATSSSSRRRRATSATSEELA